MGFRHKINQGNLRATFVDREKHSRYPTFVQICYTNRSSSSDSN